MLNRQTKQIMFTYLFKFQCVLEPKYYHKSEGKHDKSIRCSVQTERESHENLGSMSKSRLKSQRKAYVVRRIGHLARMERDYSEEAIKRVRTLLKCRNIFKGAGCKTLVEVGYDQRRVEKEVEIAKVLHGQYILLKVRKIKDVSGPLP